MLKKVFVFLFVPLLVASVFLYFKYIHTPNVESIWDLVSENSFAVYETHRLESVLEDLKTIGSYQSLSGLDAFKKIDSSYQFLENLMGTQELSYFLKDNNYLLSASLVSSEAIGFTHFIEFKSVRYHTSAKEVIKVLVQEHGFVNSKRKYLGYTISELSDNPYRVNFSYVLFGNFFVGSTDALLIEDVIRALKNEDTRSFSDMMHHANHKMVHLKSDHGNLHFYTEKLGELAKLFLDTSGAGLKTNDLALSASSFDIQFHQQHLSLTGFGFEPSERLRLFNGDNGSTNTMIDLLPENTAIFHHTSFSNSESHINNLNTYLETKDKVNTIRKELAENYDFEINAVLEFVEEEYGLIRLPGDVGSRFNDITIFKTQHREEILTYLKILVDRIAVARNRFIIEEDYREFRVYGIEHQDFTQALFGTFYGGGNTTYYTSIDNYIIMANSLKDIKYFIDQWDQESTWGKSLAKNQFLTLTNAESNYSIYFNAEEMLLAYDPYLKSGWNSYYQKNKSSLEKVTMGALQLSSIEDKFYTSLVLYTPNSALQNSDRSDVAQVLSNVTFTSEIVTKPYLIKNFYDGSFEVLVVDKNNNLLLTDKENNTIVLYEIGEPIVSDIVSMDYYKNGKTQYLFASSNYIYLIDRKGQSVEDFPIAIPSQLKITGLTLLDYNKTKDYRISVATEAGEVFLLDKKGTPLKGWKPKDLHGTLVSPIQHKRVINKDYMLTISAKGEVHAFKRNGSLVSGFPVSLGADITNPFFFKGGNSAVSSLMKILTNDGALVTINLSGAIVSREQVFRSDANTQFEMAIDAGKESFIVGAYDRDGVTVYDAQLKTLFKKAYIKTTSLGFQYYYFGRGKQLIFIHDHQSGLTHLFDAKGKSLIDKPFKSNGQLSVLHYSRNSLYKIYYTDGSELDVLELNY